MGYSLFFGGKEYSIEEAFRIIGIDSASQLLEPQKIFDEYGNYIFPTETSFCEQNQLLSASF